MSTLTRESSPVYIVAARPGDFAYAVCRTVDLPPGRGVAASLGAIRRRYLDVVGKELPLDDAIDLLDRLVSERDGVPFPAAYARVADHLVRAGYDHDAVHAMVGHLARGGSIASCPGLLAEDRVAVEDLMPRVPTPCRCRLRPDEAE